MNNSEKVNIMMHEYDALRRELDNRVTAYLKNLAVIQVVIVGVISFKAPGASTESNNPLLWFVVPFLIVAYAGYERAQMITNLVIAEYVANLEHRINKLIGEDLLIYESKVFKAGTIFAAPLLFDAKGRKWIPNPFYLSSSLAILLVLLFWYSIYKIAQELHITFDSLLNLKGLYFLSYVGLFLILLIVYIMSFIVPDAYKKIVENNIKSKSSP